MQVWHQKKDVSRPWADKTKSTVGTNGDQKADGIYLCQVSARVSCGACCGLYNVSGVTRSGLEDMLARRTEAFSGLPRTVEAIDSFARKAEGFTPEKRPFPQFHHCPFVGLVGENRERVGCLLHPLAAGNGGRDFRGLSYYGGFACRTYFCPSIRHLPGTWLTILRQTMDDWYLHGLIVTERHLLAAFFAELESRICRPARASDFAEESEAASLFREFASLKITWPYRRKGACGPCNYFFENGEYPRPAVRRAHGSIPPSHYEEILKELDSGFSSERELHEAEELLNDLFSRLKQALDSL